MLGWQSHCTSEGTKNMPLRQTEQKQNKNKTNSLNNQQISIILKSADYRTKHNTVTIYSWA